jgi:hypothetical protein
MSVPDRGKEVAKSCHVGVLIITISIDRAHRQRFRRVCGKNVGGRNKGTQLIKLPLGGEPDVDRAQLTFA